MKNHLLLILILLLTIFSNAQQTFINQGFEEGMPLGWTVYNEEGDNNEWEIINMSFWAMTGHKSVGLQTTAGANDWLVSSQIFLQETYMLSFWATEIIEGGEENITVWLSTTGNAISDFTTNLSNITVPYLGYDDEGYLYSEYRIDLSDYQGQNVYIAWQLTSTEGDGLCLIDNIVSEYFADNIEWSSLSSGYWTQTVCPVSTGGYIVAGNYQDDIFIQRLNYEGAVEWTTITDGNFKGDDAHAVIETFDDNNFPSGYILTGERGFGDFNMLIWVCKYDIEGTLEWTKEFGISGTQNQGNSVKQTNDGGCIITGYEGLNNPQIILIKLDKNGNEEWVKKFGSSDNDFAKDVVQTADGGYAVTGFYKINQGATGTIFILKTDKNGNQEFWAEYPDIDFARADGICQTSDGGFILAAFNCENSKDWRIIKTDNIGTVEWEYTSGGSEEDIPNSILQTAEGNYIIAGYKTVSENQRMWIVKLDNYGELIGETEYETTTGNSTIREIQQTQDGGYIFVGLTDTFSTDMVDGIMVKIGSDETEISQNDILSFYLPQQTGDAIIDIDNHIITITVSDETNIAVLTPVIFTSPQSGVFPGSATTQDFSENYIYTVTALDQTQQEWTVTVEGGYVSVTDQAAAEEFKIFPNPSTGVFTVKNNYQTCPDGSLINNCQLSITDITGGIIYNSTIPQFNKSIIDITNLPKGIYFIVIKTDTSIYTEKIIIQ